MDTKPLPAADYLRERLSYDPSSGELRWRSGRLAGKLIGRSRSQGYCKVFLAGVQFLAHRVIWKMVHGVDPRFIDHRDGRRDNNRLINLRECERSTNSRNARLRQDNKSGVPGVRQRSPTLWAARIKHLGRDHHLGNFRSKAEAVAARLAAGERLEFSKGHGTTDRPLYPTSRATN